MRALGEAVELEGATAGLRLAPGVEKAGFLEVFTLLLDAHVGHLQALGEVADRQALAALEFIQDLQAGAARYGLEEALLQI